MAIRPIASLQLGLFLLSLSQSSCAAPWRRIGEPPAGVDAPKVAEPGKVVATPPGLVVAAILAFAAHVDFA